MLHIVVRILFQPFTTNSRVTEIFFIILNNLLPISDILIGLLIDFRHYDNSHTLIHEVILILIHT